MSQWIAPEFWNGMWVWWPCGGRTISFLRMEDYRSSGGISERFGERITCTQQQAIAQPWEDHGIIIGFVDQLLAWQDHLAESRAFPLQLIEKNSDYNVRTNLNIFWIHEDGMEFRPQPETKAFSICFHQPPRDFNEFCGRRYYFRETRMRMRDVPLKHYLLDSYWRTINRFRWSAAPGGPGASCKATMRCRIS